MNDPYFIVALPRSRTAWLANLLTHGHSYCHHEAIVRCNPANVLHDLKEVLSNAHPHYKFTGDSDSGLPLLWPQLKEAFPSARYVFIERPFRDALKSHIKAFPCLDPVNVEDAFCQIDNALEVMRLTVDKFITVQYDQLDDPHICKYIWDFCAPGERFDFERSEMLQGLRVNQIYTEVAARAHPAFLERMKNMGAK